MSKQVHARRVDDEGNGGTLSERLTRAVLDLAGRIPETEEHKSRGPDHRARAIGAAAANKAALAAATPALPPGPPANGLPRPTGNPLSAGRGSRRSSAPRRRRHSATSIGRATTISSSFRRRSGPSLA